MIGRFTTTLAVALGILIIRANRGCWEIQHRRDTMVSLRIESNKYGVTMGYLTDLTDEQWAWVEPVFRHKKGRVPPDRQPPARA